MIYLCVVVYQPLYNTLTANVYLIAWLSCRSLLWHPDGLGFTMFHERVVCASLVRCIIDVNCTCHMIKMIQMHN